MYFEYHPNIKPIKTIFFAILIFTLTAFNCKQTDKKSHSQEIISNDTSQSEFQEYVNNVTNSNYDPETYLLKDVGYISIPKSMEIQSGKYKEFSKGIQKEMSKKYKYEISDQRVVFQNKGVNDFDKAAIENYTRVIIDTKIGHYGEYEKLTNNFTASLFEINEISRQMKKSTETELKNIGSRLIKWYGIQLILINERTSLKTTFVRQISRNKPVLVTMYQFQNNDRIHSLTLSCQVEDTIRWKKVFNDIVDSFDITNIR